MNRGKLLTLLAELELKITQVEEAHEMYFPKIDKALYNARSYPGGAFQTMHQDIQRLRQRVKEAIPG